MTDTGGERVKRRPRISLRWREYRARWTLPLVIIVIIGAVAIVDHLGSHRISQVDQVAPPALVATTGGTAAVNVDRSWYGFNPNTPAGASSATPMLLTSVLPSAYIISPKLVPQVNSDLLVSVEATSTSPLTIQYVIDPHAVWSDGVPVSADDFIYAWQSQRGSGVDVDGQPDQVASTLGYRNVASVVASHGRKTVTVVFNTPFTDWRAMFDHMVPAHIAKRVGWNTGFDTFTPSIDLSAGPMIVQSVTGGTEAVLVRNPSWWGTPSVLNRVVVSVASAPSTWIGALAGSNHAVAQPATFNLEALNAVSSLPNTQSSVKPSLNFLQVEFNVKSTVTAKAAMREAIAHSLDRPALLARTFAPIEPDLLVSQDHLAAPSQPSYSPSSASGEYLSADPASTDRLLKSLGFHQDQSGIYIDADGKPLTLRMAVETGDPWAARVATAISSQLHGAGMSVVTIPVAGSAGLAAAAAANLYDMALVTRVSSPFQTVTEPWYSDGQGPAGSGGSQDWSKFDDPQVDQLFLQAAQALNPVSGSAIYAQIDDQLWDQMVALPLFGEPALIANGVQIDNALYNPSVDGILWNVALWATLKPGPKAGQA